MESNPIVVEERRQAADHAGEVQEQDRLQRTMHDEARIALDLHGIAAVVMDAVSVEGQCGIAEQEWRGDLDLAPPDPGPEVVDVE
jgi:hypothetical protein